MCLSRGKLIELHEKLTCYKIVAIYPEPEGYRKLYYTPFRDVYIPEEAINGKTPFVAKGDAGLRGDGDNLRVEGGFIHSYADMQDALRDLIHHFYEMSLDNASGKKYELWECEIASGTFCFKGQFDQEYTPVYASGSVYFTRCIVDNEADACKMEKELLNKKSLSLADCMNP